MKKWTAMILALVMCFSLCACGSGKDTSAGSDYAEDEEYEDRELTESEAVDAVKNNVFGGMNLTEQSICRELGFKQFYTPDYGTYDAEQKEDGSWEITLRGSMSGYLDDYHSDFDTKKFELVATAEYSGNPDSYEGIDVWVVSVREVY